MLEKGRISSWQMALLLYTNVIATSVLTAPGVAFHYAERDLWLSPIWASLIGFLALYLAWKLHSIYIHKTFIQYTEQIIGKIPGMILSFLYIFYFTVGTGIALRQYAEFIVGAFLNQTPILIVMGTMMLATSIALRGGLEVAARLAEIFTPILFLLWVILMILLIPELKITSIFPVMEKGLSPSLKGAIVLQSFYALFFYVSFLLPYIRDQKKSLSWGYYSVITAVGTLVITNLTTLLLFGNITGDFLYPIMSAARYISYADFFENLESLVMLIWVGGSFIKLGLMQFVVVNSISQWLNLTDYKPLSLPAGLIITIIAYWVFPNVAEMTSYFQNTFLGIPILFVFVPAGLLLISFLRKWLGLKLAK
ncbi:endospore germination permease [Ammoniphilus sp. YIM 78166]|uniref:GerAB/ArcD/ProY family transporter n=1 Tax=Ammoniphilus sp. YIM 78166 TaxID=1644106 RepID=UPI00106FFBB7|nr:endospore germination permease [Ammoniphilus sp. YIM 78166]